MTKRRLDNRQAPISWRPPEGRRDEAFALAEAKGLSINAFITACVFGLNSIRNARRSSSSDKAFARIMAQSARNESYIQRSPNLSDEEKALLSDVNHQIRSECMHNIGRKS